MSEYKATTIKAITTDDATQKISVFLDGTSGLVRAGSYGKEGELQLMPSNLADGGNVSTADDLTGAHATIRMKASNAHVRIGGGDASPGTVTTDFSGRNGKLTLQNAARKDVIVLDAATSDVWVGAGDSALALLHFDANGGHLKIGGGSKGEGPVQRARDGALTLKDSAGNDRLQFDATAGIAVKRLNGGDPETVASLDDGGTLKLKHRGTKSLETTISLEANGGKVQVYDNAGDRQIYLHGESGNVELYQGHIKLDKGGVILAEGGVTLAKGDVVVNGGGNIHVRDNGDITVGGSDCAEEFDCVDAAAIEAGTVVVIDEGGALRPSRDAYDRRVAGVVSGAGAFKPGLVLGRDQPGTNRTPVALVGKVYCRVDAEHGPIAVGDLLTTSATPGHAMRAGEPGRAFGAVIGKAMRPLASGQGLIPILIALQ